MRQGLLNQVPIRVLYLLHQGITIRIHTELDVNLYQLLKVLANDNSDTKQCNICHKTLLQSRLL